MFRHIPILLVSLIVSLIALYPCMPLGLQQSLLALSLIVKSFIIFLLPLIIFSLLFKTMVGLANRATVVIGLILACVISSNFVATFISHYIGVSLYHLHFSTLRPHNAESLMPLWSWEFPKLMNNNKALLMGIITGMLFTRIKPVFAQTLAIQLDRFSGMLLNGIVYLIPLFVAGFVVKLCHDGVMTILFKDYALIFLIVAVAQCGYVGLIYLFLNNFNVMTTIKNIKNILPAALAGFSAMSSAAAMPLTMLGAANNARNKELARSIIPITVNIHLLGDCIAIPIFAYALMKGFGLSAPTLILYTTFVCYFVVAKFSVAAVPGGGILVMLPILESQLGFTGEMLSMITALYVLFDPVITFTNVLGNGALAKLIDNLALRQLKSST